MKGLLLLIAGLTAAVPLPAKFITLSVTAANQAGDLVGESPDTLVSAPVVRRGPALLAVTDFPGFYDSKSWATGLTFPGAGSGSFLGFSFSIAEGYQWLPGTLSTAYQDAGSGHSASILELRHAADGFASILFSDTAVVAFPNGNDVNPIDISALAPMTGVVEFRLYGYGADNADGVLGLANDAALEQGGLARAVLISGTVEPVPEPALSALVAGLALFLLLRLLKKP